MIQFHRVEESPIASDLEVSIGCAWVDFDNDLDLDLFVTNLGAPNRLYINDLENGFRKVDFPTDSAFVNYSIGCAWADFDNDGWTDLFLTQHASHSPDSQARNLLYRNLGPDGFENVTGRFFEATTDIQDQSLGCAWSDFDRDGRLDLFVANWPRHENYLFRSSHDGTFKRHASPFFQVLQNSEGTSWADYDNDGDPDLFVSNGSFQGNGLYENDGLGGFSAHNDSPVSQERKSSRGGSWGDFNNDGLLDLVVTNAEWLSLFKNGGASGFVPVAEDQWNPSPTSPGNYSGAIWGDYDNDGWLDLFVASGRGNYDEANLLFHNQGDGTFVRVEDSPVTLDGGRSWSCAWGDYDNDGFLDLFVTNGGYLSDAEPPEEFNFLYRNSGNSNHWLKVSCQGAVSNRSGIGARIEVVARIRDSTVTQVREISGGMGAYTGGQDGLMAHFGLGDASIVETLRIRWPSGLVQVVNGVNVNQWITIREPNLVIHGIVDGKIRIELQGLSSLPIYIQTSDDLQHWETSGFVSELKEPRMVLEDFDKDQHTRFYRIANSAQ